MPTAYLLIGSNMGNRLTYLQQAQQLISLQCGNIIKESSTYKTAAWGYTEQPDFYNKVLVLQTLLQPAALMQNLLLIEEKMGRKREIKMGPRIIDLDILLMDDIILNTGLLTLPHPALTQRRFALLPLAEVAPQLQHSVEKKSISTLLQLCTDTLDVQKIIATT